MRKSTFLLITALTLGLSSCSNSSAQIQSLDRKGLAPVVATSGSGSINIAYGYQDSIFFQQSTNAGESFGSPTVVGVLANMPLRMGSGPQICTSGKYKSIIAPGNGGSLFAWYSDSKGESWSGPAQINDVDGSAGESLLATTFVNDTTLIAVWIDTRKTESAHDSQQSHTESAEYEEIKFVTPKPDAKQVKMKYPDENGDLRWVIKDGDGNLIDAEDLESYKRFVAGNRAMAQTQASLFASYSYDGGASWSANSLVYKSPDGSICECCKPSIASDGNSNVTVMFRNNLAGNRDMYLASSSDAGTTFGSAKKLGEGTWKINACPMDGGAITLDKSGAPITVWQREGKLYTSDSDQPEKEIASGQSARVAKCDTGMYLAWANGLDIMLLAPDAKQPKKFATGTNLQMTALGAKSGAILVWSDGEKVMYSVL